MIRRVFLPLFCLFLILPAHAAPFRGKIVGANDQPVAGARLFVSRFENNEQIAREFPVAPDGGFSFEYTPTDAPELDDEDAPTDAAKISVTIFAPNWAIHSAVLGAEAKTIVLEPSQSLKGTVKNLKGEPVEGVLVGLQTVYRRDTTGETDFSAYILLPMDSALSEAFQTKSGADGRFEIANLPDKSTIYLSIRDPRFVNSSLNTELPKEVNLVAKPGAALKGRVATPDKTGVEGLSISAYSPKRSANSQAKTGANGEFELAGLDEGQATISVRDAKNEWAGASAKADAKAGETTQIPDVVLQKGVVLEGVVVDVQTEKPLAGAQVSSGFNEVHSNSTKATGDDGKFSIRVLPGNGYLYLSSAPKGYLRLQNSRQTTIEATPETQTVPPIRLSRGVMMSGTARDENGKIPAKATFRAGDQWEGGSSAVVDEKGQWKTGALKSGSIALTGTGEWEVVAPKNLTVPALDAPNPPVQITLRKLQLQTAMGRVVDDKGDPIEGVKIRFRQFFDAQRNSRGYLNLTSDAKGQFTSQKLRPEQSLELEKAEKVGFQFVSGGKESKGTDWTIGDIIMAPLNGRVTGKITDQNGDGVAGALVSASGKSPFDWATSAADGTFEIKDLTLGKLTVWAAKDKFSARVEAEAGEDIELKLAPSKDANFDELWAKVLAEKDNYMAGYLAREIAPFEPEKAWQWIETGDSPASNGDARRSLIIAALAKSDAKRALQWAPAKLAEIGSENDRFSASAALARAAIKQNPDWAKNWLAENAAKVAPYDFSTEGANRLFALAGIAARLGQTDAANEFFERGRIAQLHADSPTPNDQEGYPGTNTRAANWAKSVAFGGANWLGKLGQGQSPREKLQIWSAGLDTAAQSDADGALQLFETMRALRREPEIVKMDEKSQVDNGRWNPDSAYYLNRALRPLAVEIAPKNPEKARELVKQLNNDGHNKPTVLAAIAYRLHKSGQDDEARKFAREAADSVSTWNYEALPRLMSVAATFDPKLAGELRQTASEQLRKPNANDYTPDGVSVAPLAFYMAPDQPAQTRILVESEWAQLQKSPSANRNQDWQRRSKLGRLIRAVATVDVNRALEMIDATPEKDISRGQLRSQIVAYLLLPLSERRVMAFQDWSGGEEDLFD